MEDTEDFATCLLRGEWSVNRSDWIKKMKGVFKAEGRICAEARTDRRGQTWQMRTCHIQRIKEGYSGWSV